jgi:hypothetical protein
MAACGAVGRGFESLWIRTNLDALFRPALYNILSTSYGLKSADVKRQYPRRLKVFLDFLNLEGDLEKQAHDFMTKAKVNPQ